MRLGTATLARSGKTRSFTSLPFGALLFLEGDSNTAWDSRKTNWVRHLIMRSAGRLRIPPGGDFANGGAVAAHHVSGNGNSMEDRLPSFLVKLNEYAGSRIALFMIGTNPDADFNGVLALDRTKIALTNWISAVRSAGVIVACIMPFARSGEIVGGYRDQLRDWLDDPGRVDLILDARDPAGANIIAPDDLYDGIHLDSLGDRKLGTAVANWLNSLTSTDTIYTGNPTSAIDGTFSGNGGTAGAGASGEIATGWTASRTVGADGTISCSKVTLDGKVAQRMRFDGGSGDTTFTLARTYTVSQLANEVWDWFATVQMVTGSNTPLNAFLSAQPSNSGSTDHTFFPGSVGTNIDPDDWSGSPYLWRTYADVRQAANASQVDVIFQVQIQTGKDVTFDIADLRMVRRE